MKRILSIIVSVLVLFAALPLGAVSADNVYGGDVNADGKVNVKDIGLLQQYINGWDVILQGGSDAYSSGDGNGDGKVNVRDLGLMQQWLNGWDVTLQNNPEKEAMIGGLFEYVDSDTTIYATTDKTTACAGQEVMVDISIVNNPGLAGWNVGMIFDESAFEVVEIIKGDGISSGPLKSPITATFADFLYSDVTTDGLMYRVELKVKSDAPAGTYSILLGTANNDPDNFSTQNFETVDVALVGTTITVVEGMDIYAGDANEDGKTNIRDMGLMQQWMNGWDVMLNISVADVNADGKVNVRDLGLMQQWMNTWDVTLKTTPPPEEPMIGAPAGNSPLDPTATAIYATVDKSAVCEGGEIVLTISIANNPGLSGWNVAAAFDETAFELLSLTAGDIFPASGMTYGPVDRAYSQSYSRGIASATYADFISKDVAGDGTLYTAVLKVKPDAAPGTYDILLGTRNNDRDNFSTQDYQSVPVIFEGASVTIAHSYDNECDELCDVCGAFRDVGGHISDAVYACQWGYCIHCGVYVNPVTDHIYDNTCDDTCDECGFQRDIRHRYDDCCDDTCNECGAIRTAPGHSYQVTIETPTCEESGYTLYLCWYCNDYYTDNITPPLGHVYDSDYDVSCNECGAIREIVVILGDANNDGRVNVRDLGLIEQYIQRYNVAMDTQAADVNGDGKINIRDLGLLQQYLNGWDVELG